MTEEKTYKIGAGALSRGPDLLRPGSSTAKYGQGRYAFLVTKYPNSQGVQFHKAGAATGHESLITKPEIIEGLFGPNLDKVLPDIRVTTDEYVYDPETFSHVATGKTYEAHPGHIPDVAAEVLKKARHI